MSKLHGLSLISKDPDNSNKKVRFINIDDTNLSEPIFIAGVATDYYENDEATVKSSDIESISHGKFSNLSLIKNENQAADDSINIQKGQQNYVYIDIQTGQLKTNSFNDLFENHILNTNVTEKLALFDENGQVEITAEQLRQLKSLLSSN